MENTQTQDLPQHYQKAQNQLETLLNKLQNGQIEQTVEKAFITPQEGDQRPFHNWSIRNKIMALIAGTNDARGYQQWQKAGRQVQKGAQSIRILAPNTYTKTVQKDTNEYERLQEKDYAEKKKENTTQAKFEVFTGFKAVPVFKYEDTEPIKDFDGEVYKKEDLDYTPEEMPALKPLAEKLEVQVEYKPAHKPAYGSYNPEKEKIKLHTEDKQTFYHELSHKIDKELQNGLKNGQHPIQEAVAEISGNILCNIYEGEQKDGYTVEYLENYAQKDMTTEDAYDLALKVIGRVEKVLEETIRRAENLETHQAESEAPTPA